MVGKLTDRERQVLWLAAKGMTTIQIGRELEISPETVRTHLARIRDKTGTRTKGEAVYHVYWRHFHTDIGGRDEGGAGGAGTAAPA